jgi:hypothetical protein
MEHREDPVIPVCSTAPVSLSKDIGTVVRSGKEGCMQRQKVGVKRQYYSVLKDSDYSKNTQY